MVPDVSGYPTSIADRVQAAIGSAAIGLPPRALRLLTGAPVVRDGQTLDPDVQMMLRLMALEGRPAIETLPVPEARAELLRITASVAGPPPAVAQVTEVTVRGAAGPLPARLFVPHERAADTASPLLLYFHGGGWVIGDRDTHDAACRLLARSAGVRVLSVDYRMAPEHLFPAATDDAYAAFADVHANASRYGADPERIAVGGDSAGGNLAAVCAQRALAEGGPVPAFQLLIYPVTDNSSQDTASYRMFGEGFFLTASVMTWFRAHYFGADEATRSLDPAASPLLADDLAGLPPAHVVTAGFDVLRDEGEAYAARLRDAGVTVTTRRHSGLIHGFVHVLAPRRGSRDAVLEMGGVLRAALAG